MKRDWFSTLITEDDLSAVEKHFLLKCMREKTWLQIAGRLENILDRSERSEQIGISYSKIKKHCFFFLKKKKLFGRNIRQSYFLPLMRKNLLSLRNKMGMLSELNCKDWQYSVKTIARREKMRGWRWGWIEKKCSS